MCFFRSFPKYFFFFIAHFNAFVNLSVCACVFVLDVFLLVIYEKFLLNRAHIRTHTISVLYVFRLIVSFHSIPFKLNRFVSFSSIFAWQHSVACTHLEKKLHFGSIQKMYTLYAARWALLYWKKKIRKNREWREGKRSSEKVKIEIYFYVI